jgi:hypothetical protein
MEHHQLLDNRLGLWRQGRMFMGSLKTGYIFMIATLSAFLLTSCMGSGVVYENETTATAQAQRAILQATAMAQGLKGTAQVIDEGARATAAAREDLFDSAAAWEVVHSDGFEANEVNWFEGSDEDPELAQISWEIAGGKYIWQAEAYDGFIWWVVPDVELVDDFYYSVTAQQSDGPETGEYGMVFRQSDLGSYYVFGISETGQFSVYLFDDQQWKSLIDWSESTTIKTGAPNTLSIIAQDSTYYLLINDEQVGEFEDARLTGGQVGLMISLSEAGDTAIWEFDDYELRAP